MATSRVDLHRERASDWPIFGTVGGLDDVGVLSVETTRSAAEDMVAAVARASDVLRAGLARVTADGSGHWLLAMSRPVLRAQRVASLRAGRTGLWGALEGVGRHLPQGPRSEVPIEYPSAESWGFGGSIGLPLAELPKAIEVTRMENAVCVVTGSSASDPLTTIAPGPLELVDGKSPNVLLRAVHSVADRTLVFAARGFGEFSDVTVGAEVFAHGGFLDSLETVLHDIRGGTP